LEKGASLTHLPPQRKSQIFGSLFSTCFSACFSASFFFVFENNWNIFFIVRALPKRLINVVHDFIFNLIKTNKTLGWILMHAPFVPSI
jgi:hypothetical protein